MTTVLIMLLLASNLLMVAVVMKKPLKPTAADEIPEKQAAPEKSGDESPASPETSTPTVEEAVVNKTQIDPELLRRAVEAEARKVVPLIIKEYGTPEDAGLPDAPEKNEAQVDNSKLDEVFTHNTTASELTDEEPPMAEPQADGLDFNDMNATMRVLKDKPHTKADEQTAVRTVAELQGTDIIEVIKLDPVIRKRILMIECQLPEVDERPTTPDGKPKKIIFHADIDATDIDSIDFNIIH